VTRRTAIFLAAILLFTACQGCASRKTALVPVSDKKLGFTQQYDLAKYLISTGQLDRATSQLKKLERKAKSDVERAMVSDTKASLHLARHELVSAEEDASRAIEVFPSLASAHRVRAFARRERGNLSGAVEDFRSVLAIEPGDTESLRGLAEILIAQNRIVESVRILERFLQVDSLDAEAQEAWCSSMASLIGLDRFPIEYLRMLRTNALTRGELAAVLVVELEMTRLELEGSGKSEIHTRELVDIRPNRGTTSSTSMTQPIDSLKPASEASYARLNSTSETSVPVPDCGQFWFAPFVEKAVNLGLLDAYPDGTFRPWDIVRKGILTLDLYSFLNRHCENALTDVRSGLRESSLGIGDRAASRPDFDRTRIREYSDLDDSSYLWGPVITLTALGIVTPASSDSFGIDIPLSAEETRVIARNLARVMLSRGCKVSD
jgi:tetratricopeptide (TPR) repeat protein